MLNIKSMFTLPCVHMFCTSHIHQFHTKYNKINILLHLLTVHSDHGWYSILVFSLIDQSILFYLSNCNSCAHCYGFSSCERLCWTACALHHDAKLSSQLRQQWCFLTVIFSSAMVCLHSHTIAQLNKAVWYTLVCWVRGLI